MIFGQPSWVLKMKTAIIALTILSKFGLKVLQVCP